MEHAAPSEMIGSGQRRPIHEIDRQSSQNNLMHENGLTTLDQLAPMQIAVVQRISSEDVDAARLKRLGICEGRQVQMVKSDDPLIIRVVGTRVGISARLAPAIHVRPCPSDEKPPHDPNAATPNRTLKDQT